MFYAHIVLAQKGPLARIWLAAHWDKKLTKAHVFETNIEQSVDGIMQPKVKLALRTSGHLLLGVVRIYSRKAKYLLADCNEAFVKIKMAFRPGMVDLPEGHREAAVNAITLPEVFHDFDTALPELNDIDIEAQFSITQSRADEITMREDYGSLSMSMQDDGFGDMGFDAETPDMDRHGLEPTIDDSFFVDDLRKESMPGTSRGLGGDDLLESHLEGDGFGDDNFGQPAAGLFEGDIFGEPTLPPQPVAETSELPGVADDHSDDEMDHFDGGAPSPMGSSMGSRPPSVLGHVEEAATPLAIQHMPSPRPEDVDDGEHLLPPPGEEAHKDEAVDHTTLLNNEEESFALAPVDASAYKGVTKAKRKRKLIVDEVKNISGEEMKSQLASTSDIVTTLDLAPPTKRLMYWKETGGVEKLFSLPSRDIPARGLFANYQRHLISRLGHLEDFSIFGPPDLLALESAHQEPESPHAKRGRKRKLPLPEPAPLPVDVSTSSTLPEVIRDRSEIMPEMDLMPPPPEPSMREDMSAFDGGIPMTPGGLSHGMDMHDDFHHSGLTPADLHHGGMTPHHPEIESLESIPLIPPEQVTSILHEAEGLPAIEEFADLGIEAANRSAELASDWADYEFPQSVGPPQPSEEQQENETDEQFEERVLNKRAAQTFFSVRNILQKRDELYLSEMTVRNNRKQAAQKFYSLLVLKKVRALDITQPEPYADICIRRGVMFDNPKL